MSDQETRYLREVWAKAVSDAEARVMRLTPTLSGGRKRSESVEAYAARARSLQDEALANLATARVQYVKVAPADLDDTDDLDDDDDDDDDEDEPPPAPKPKMKGTK